MPASKKTLYERTLLKTLDINMAAKSLANFVFRSVIEDVHSDYDISQDEMKVMNKKAVNRAAAFLNCIGNDELLSALIWLNSLETTRWDNPKETADTREKLKLAKKYAEGLCSVKGKTNTEIVTE